jgi:hypothetical protein
MDILEHNNNPINEELEKKIQVFLSWYKYIGHNEKIPWEERKRTNIELFEKYWDIKYIEKELWLELESIYSMYYKDLKVDRFRTDDLKFSSDSSVFKIKWTNDVLKIYFHLWKPVIERYHKISNQIASKRYNTEYQGEFNWEKFDRIEFDVHKLPQDWIVWTKENCITIIPEVKSELNVDIDFSKKDKIRREIVPYIIRKINEENNLKIDEEEIDPMNIAFHKIENGTLYLTITDLWTRIKDFLEYFEKEESKKTSNLKQTIIWKIFSLLRIQKK